MISIIMMDINIPEPFDQLPFSAIRRIGLAKGEKLFLQEDPTLGLFFLQNGRLRLSRVHIDGTLVTIHNAKSGQMFAEASLFSERYHCDAIAIAECDIIRFDKAQTLAALENNPIFALALAQYQSRQIQAYRRRLEIMSIRNANDKVYSAFREGFLSGTIIEMADEVGLTREAVYRALASLVRSGKIHKIGRGNYTTISPDS